MGEKVENQNNNTDWPTSMESDQLAHLDRIAKLVELLPVLPWMNAEEIDGITAVLLDFDATYWSFIRILSLPLYAELASLLGSLDGQEKLSERPRISAIVPVYGAKYELLLPALRSLRQQIGVSVEILISVDGCRDDYDLVNDILSEIDKELGSDPYGSALVLFSEDNLGVGRCRNRALRCVSSQWFTCLDADDLFHPLRCLHGLMALASLRIDRLNTGWSRVSLAQKKVVLLNDRLSAFGHNSYISCSNTLQRYGYLADLRVHEDTEYQQRLAYFGASMQISHV